MDNTQSTPSWQPNTFMDIISPKARPSSPRTAPSRSSTLMRTAVKKPSIITEPIALTQANEPQPTATATPRANLTEAATMTDQSPLVSRFSDSNSIEEYQPPTATAFDNPVETPAAEQAIVHSAVDEDRSALPSTEAAEAVMTPTSPSIFEDIMSRDFDFSQPEPIKASKWSRIKGITGWTAIGMVAVVVVVSGLILNANFDKIEFGLASSKAGFSAVLPSVKPVGYDLASVSTGSGSIQANFKSNSDGRTYSINEKHSNITSSQLFSSYVQPKAGLNYQTINSNNKTIYVYNGHNATWVTNGIWYVITDNNSLSNHQILQIADSV